MIVSYVAYWIPNNIYEAIHHCRYICQILIHKYNYLKRISDITLHTIYCTILIL